MGLWEVLWPGKRLSSYEGRTAEIGRCCGAEVPQRDDRSTYSDNGGFLCTPLQRLYHISGTSTHRWGDQDLTVHERRGLNIILSVISWVVREHEMSLSVCRAEDTEWGRGSAVRCSHWMWNSKVGDTLFLHEVSKHEHNILKTGALNMMAKIKNQAGVDHWFFFYNGYRHLLCCLTIWDQWTEILLH